MWSEPFGEVVCIGKGGCTKISSAVQAQNRAMENIVLALTTVPEGFDTATLALSLVEAGHAACVSVLPVHVSTYRWQGAIDTAREHQVVIKTTDGRVPALEAAIRAVHPYDVPEFLIVPVTGGGQDYLEWILGAAGPTGPTGPAGPTEI